ncbi:unnamed protein product [Caenorhabditis auriculariae]|uniref:Uncharacterized protein n=1 Tax=Caenorhabditis auriculariae TaxID=2777116 RepID=A0A8S1H6I5_9PELO|nr:unnamed protein product [Caenorhabditis auriculariae]
MTSRRSIMIEAITPPKLKDICIPKRLTRDQILAKKHRIGPQLMKKIEQEAELRRTKTLRAALEQEKRKKLERLKRREKEKRLRKAAEAAEKKNEGTVTMRTTSHCSIVLQPVDTNAAITLKKPLSTVEIMPKPEKPKKPEDGPTRKRPHSAMKIQGAHATKQQFSKSCEQSFESRNIQSTFGGNPKLTENKSALDRPCKTEKVQPISVNKPELPNKKPMLEQLQPAVKNPPITYNKGKALVNEHELKSPCKTNKIEYETKLRRSTTVVEPQASAVAAIKAIDQVQVPDLVHAAPPAPFRGLGRPNIGNDRSLYCYGGTMLHEPLSERLQTIYGACMFNGKMATHCQNCAYFPVHLNPNRDQIIENESSLEPTTVNKPQASGVAVNHQLGQVQDPNTVKAAPSAPVRALAQADIDNRRSIYCYGGTMSHEPLSKLLQTKYPPFMFRGKMATSCQKCIFFPLYLNPGCDQIVENEFSIERPYTTDPIQSAKIDEPQASTVPALNQIDQIQAQNPAQAAPPAPVRALAQAVVELDHYVSCPGKAHSHKPIYGKLEKNIPRKRWNGKLVTNCRKCGFFPVYLLPYCEASGPLVKFAHIRKLIVDTNNTTSEVTHSSKKLGRLRDGGRESEEDEKVRTTESSIRLANRTVSRAREPIRVDGVYTARCQATMTKTRRSAILIPALLHKTVPVERPPNRKSFMRAPARQKLISYYMKRKFEREAIERRTKIARAALEEEKKRKLGRSKQREQDRRLRKAAEAAEKKNEGTVTMRTTSHCSIVLQPVDTNASITLKKPLSTVEIMPKPEKPKKPEDGPTRKLPHSTMNIQKAHVTEQKYSDSYEQFCKICNIQPMFKNDSTLEQPSDHELRIKLPKNISRYKEPHPAVKNPPITKTKVKAPVKEHELKSPCKTDKIQSKFGDKSKLTENESVLERPFKTGKIQSSLDPLLKLPKDKFTLKGPHKIQVPPITLKVSDNEPTLQFSCKTDKIQPINNNRPQLSKNPSMYKGPHPEIPPTTEDLEDEPTYKPPQNTVTDWEADFACFYHCLKTKFMAANIQNMPQKSQVEQICLNGSKLKAPNESELEQLINSVKMLEIPENEDTVPKKGSKASAVAAIHRIDQVQAQDPLKAAPPAPVPVLAQADIGQDRNLYCPGGTMLHEPISNKLQKGMHIMKCNGKMATYCRNCGYFPLYTHAVRETSKPLVKLPAAKQDDSASCQKTTSGPKRTKDTSSDEE